MGVSGPSASVSLHLLGPSTVDFYLALTVCQALFQAFNPPISRMKYSIIKLHWYEISKRKLSNREIKQQDH
jgi:hypothetical protein